MQSKIHMKSIISILLSILFLNTSALIAQPKTDYQLRVGKLIIPLKIVKGPTNYYKGRIEVYKDDIVENIKEVIGKYKKETPVYGDKLLVYYASHNVQSGNNQMSFTLDLQKDSKLPADFIKNLIDKVEPKDNISFQSMATVDSVALSNVVIYVKDPNQAYRPPKYPTFNGDNGVYSYQLVGGLKKTLLKADTTVESNKRLVAAYRDKNKFDIMHIPGYRTKNRYIKPTDSFWPEDEIDNTVNLSKTEFKPFYLYPEIAVESESSCFLKWGKMNGSPISMSNSVELFNQNINSPLDINVPNQKVHVVHFEMLVAPDIGLTIKYICDNIQQPEVQEVLKKVENHTTVYLQNFMVKDDAGNLFYFPVTYAILVAAK